MNAAAFKISVYVPKAPGRAGRRRAGVGQGRAGAGPFDESVVT